MTVRELKNYIDGLLSGGFVTEDSEIQCESPEFSNYNIVGFTIWRNGDVMMKIFETSEHNQGE